MERRDPHAYTGVTNMEFLRGGGTVEEYRGGIRYGIDQEWFAVADSSSRAK
jgi:hypothetical protein